MMFKRAISPVIATVIMIAIVIVGGITVWVFINDLLEENIEETEACFGIFDKVQINERYTCFDSANEELDVSIAVGEVDLSSLIISVSGNRKTLSYELGEGPAKVVTNIYPYGGSEGDAVNLTGADSGATYSINLDSETGADMEGGVDSVEIYPSVKGKKCGKTDSMTEVESCLALG